MINVAQYSSGTVFISLIVSTLLVAIDWRFVGIAWIVLLGWYLLIRWTLSDSKEYAGRPLYVSLAILSLVAVPILAIAGLVIGDSAFRSIAEQNEQYLAPIITLAILFVVHSVWAAAKTLVISEEKNAAERALRWEKTVKTSLAMYFWPVGVWSVQGRLQAAAK